MAQVLAIHHFELLPGASAEALEQLLAANPFQTLPGWKTRYAKGERGERAGKYALIHEFDSVEIRDRYFPSEAGAPSAEVLEIFNDPKFEVIGPQWAKLATSIADTVHTDYIILE